MNEKGLAWKIYLRILNFHLLGFNQETAKNFKTSGVLAAEKALKDFLLVLAMCEEHKQKIVDDLGEHHTFIVRQLLWTVRDIVLTFFSPENIQRTRLILQERVRLSEREGLGKEKQFASSCARLDDRDFYEHPYSEISNILERIFRFSDGKEADLINALQKALIDGHEKVIDIEVFHFK